MEALQADRAATPRLPLRGCPSLQTAVHQQQEELHQAVTQTFKVEHQATRLDQVGAQLVFTGSGTALPRSKVRVALALVVPTGAQLVAGLLAPHL